MSLQNGALKKLLLLRDLSFPGRDSATNFKLLQGRNDFKIQRYKVIVLVVALKTKRM